MFKVYSSVSAAADSQYAMFYMEEKQTFYSWNGKMKEHFESKVSARLRRVAGEWENLNFKFTKVNKV